MAQQDVQSRLEAIKGNASDEVKKHVLGITKAPPFGKDIMMRAVLSEIDIEEYTTGDGKKKEVCKVVFEMTVEEGRWWILLCESNELMAS